MHYIAYYIVNNSFIHTQYSVPNALYRFTSNGVKRKPEEGGELMKKQLSPWGTAVKVEMAKRSWTYRDLANAIGFNASYICSVVNERVISPPAIRYISKALEIDEPIDLSETG